ncbi:MAG: STAS domain-containing protein [Acidimicrobiales bacterium]
MASHLRVLHLGDMTVVGLVGDLALETAQLADDEVHRALERDSTIIVLDCSLLRSLGEEEVAVLAHLGEQVHDNGGRLVIRQPNEPTKALFDATEALRGAEIEN